MLLLKRISLVIIFLVVLASSAYSCDEVIHLWQPCIKAANVSFLTQLSGDVFWNRIMPFISTNNEKLSVFINESKFEDLGRVIFDEIASDTILQEGNSLGIFPRINIIIPSAWSSMQLQVDMVCYFGITVRNSMFTNYLIRYCLLDKTEKLLAVDEIPLKVGLEIDWVFTGNYLTGGLSVHRVALLNGGQVDTYTLWTKTDVDNITAKK